MNQHLAAIAHGLASAVAGDAIPREFNAAIVTALPFVRAVR